MANSQGRNTPEHWKIKNAVQQVSVKLHVCNIVAQIRYIRCVITVICTHLLDHLPYSVQHPVAPFFKVFVFRKIQICVPNGNIALHDTWRRTQTPMCLVAQPTIPTCPTTPNNSTFTVVDASWNVMAHAQKPDCLSVKRSSPFKSRQFSRLLAAEVCASAVVMLHTPRSEVVWRVLATHSIRQFPLHFPSRASPCAITFQLESTLI